MGTYSNKFTFEVGEMVRITFVDERAAAAEGVPASQTPVGEHVMTRDNARQLAVAITAALERTKPK